MLLVPQTAAVASKVFLLCFGHPVLSFRSWWHSVYFVVLFWFVCHISRGGATPLFVILLLLILISRVLYGAVFPLGSVRFGAVNRRIFALLKTAPHRTVGFMMLENRTEPHRRIYHSTEPYRRIFAVFKTAPHRTVGLTISENRTEPHRSIHEF